MLTPSSSSSHSKKGNRPSRGKSPRQEFPELSDVPCYTCRRRHVKCDKILPHCAKCAKKGVPCLGYQKPLRWADGVAVRGKLKGKSQPVVDNQALSIAQNTFEETYTFVREEVAHFGLPTTSNYGSDVVSDNASFLELISYHNTTICAEHYGSEHSQRIVRQIAPLSPEAVQKLPRELVNCILGIAAVHRAVRNPGNRAIEQLALEMKVNLLQGINRMFQNLQVQRTDLLFCCIVLMFVMDAMEYGTSRWTGHIAAALKILAYYGGMENFALHFPHTKLTLAGMLHQETMQVLLCPQPTQGSKHASRKGVETLCYDPEVRRSFSVVCPLRLMQAVYDLGLCAQNIFRAHGLPSIADVYTREWILYDVLQFQPEEATNDIKETYFSHRELTASELQAWNLVFSAWRGAVIIFVLRHLYFGLPNPEMPTHLSRSPTPSIGTAGVAQPALFDEPLDLIPGLDEPEAGYSIEESIEPYYEQTSLAPKLSHSSSPLPSARPSADNISFDYWNRRYDIHNEAFSELSRSLLVLAEDPDPSNLRYVLMPLMVLALVSRPNSPERTLCLKCFERFKTYMADAAVPPNPVGGAALDFVIPWDKLDAYSEGAERERKDSVVFVDNTLAGSAPEWNWWYMLERVELKSTWPIVAGTMHMELGTEFFPFSVLTGIVNEECFAAFMQPPPTQQSSSSA